MRTYHDIKLADHTISTRELHGEEIVRAGRYLIARTLLDLGAATVDPLSPDNPLIFSAGPFAGTSFSNANRTSVGCKSPLTGGIKEANGGGTFSYALGQQKIAGFTLHGASPELGGASTSRRTVPIDFDDATPYLGKGNFEANEMLLHALRQEGQRSALCGPVGEYQGLIARHRVQRQGRAAGPAGRTRRRGGGHGQQEGQGHRGRPRQDPAVQRAQEGQRRHQGLREDAAGRRRSSRTSTSQARHHGHGRRPEPDGRPAGEQLQRGPAGRRLHRREVQDGRRVHRPS